jgi:hypothetical protein
VLVARALEKELKRPDEFVTFWTKLGQAISAHRGKVAALAVVVALGVGAVWGVTIYRRSKAAKATLAFERIDRIANADLLPAKDADDTGKATMEEDDGIPHAKTESERLTAANQAADAYLAVFGSAGLGRKVLFDKAGRLLVLGAPGQAEQIYQDLAGSEPDHDLGLLEREGVALALEAEGKLDDALRAFASLAEECQAGTKFYLDRAWYGQARILERQGKGKDAAKILREILEKVPKTDLRTQIDDRLALASEK